MVLRLFGSMGLGCGVLFVPMRHFMHVLCLYQTVRT